MTDSDTKAEKLAAKRSSSVLSLFAVLLALLALIVAGWVGWQQMLLQTLPAQVSGEASQLRELTRRVDTLAEDTLEQRVAALNIRSSLEAELSALKELPVRVGQLEGQVAAIPGINQQSRNDWLKTEALYYMRIANAQALLAGDGEVAASALRLADDKLRQTGDPAMTAVRAKLADEIAALEAMPVVDRAGISFRLQSIINLSNSWPLKAAAPERFEPAAAEVNAELGPWERFVATIKRVFLSIVSVKQTDVTPIAQLGAAEQGLVVESIKAELQVARLAFATGNTELFESTLTRAADQIALYFDAEANSVQSALATIAEIQNTEAPAALPDISGSLSLMLSTGKPALPVPAEVKEAVE